MTELRRDPIVERWIIVEQDHPLLPQDFVVEAPSYGESLNCPYCYGNEHMTLEEIQAFRGNGGSSNSSGWSVRVVPDKFPALRIEGDLEKRGLGMFDISNGVGAHEIIIETPDHQTDFADLPQAQIHAILKMYCLRMEDLKRDPRFKYAMVFKNFGFNAGAILDHNHSQLIAMPMIPKNVGEELTGAARYYDFKHRCIFCDIIKQEQEQKVRIVDENEFFISLCPYASRFAFETWILPKQHALSFEKTTEENLGQLAQVLKRTLEKIKKVLKNPAYNFIIHTSPIDDKERLGYHWHIEIMPRLMQTAGFEWGTGFYMVKTPPEQAAKFLREI